MKKFAFISRHIVNVEQEAIAKRLGIELCPIGDMDAFTVQPGDVRSHGEFEGVIVVHPAMAMRLCRHYMIGVFENAKRAPEGEKPSFKAIALHVYA